MSLVRENINFERGQDPKKSMDIGMTTERKMDYICRGCEWKKPGYCREGYLKKSLQKKS